MSAALHSSSVHEAYVDEKQISGRRFVSWETRHLSECRKKSFIIKAFKWLNKMLLLWQIQRKWNKFITKVVELRWLCRREETVGRLMCLVAVGWQRYALYWDPISGVCLSQVKLSHWTTWSHFTVIPHIVEDDVLRLGQSHASCFQALC